MRRSFLLGAVLATVLLGPVYGQAAPNEAIKRNNFGMELLKQGRLDQAVAEFRRAVEADPSYAAAHLNLGYAYSKLDKLDEAIAAYTKGLALDPKDLLGQNNLGVLYDRQGRYDEAIAAFEAALGIDPSNAAVSKNLERARHNKAVIREQEDRIAEARRQAEAHPEDAAAAFNLARKYATFGHKDEAFEWLTRARSLGYDNLDFLKGDPTLAGLRDDPRFEQILKQK